MIRKAVRALLIVVLALALVAFGTCGTLGTVFGLLRAFADIRPSSWQLDRIACFLFGAGAVGLLIAWLCWVLLMRVWRGLVLPPE